VQEVIVATVDLQDVRGQRASFNSRSAQAADTPRYHRVIINISLSHEEGVHGVDVALKPTAPIFPRYHKPQEEIALGPACWLWDYLRRSRAVGFFLPLSGGLDSCSVAVIVFSMCQLVVKRAEEGDEQVILDARRIVGEPPQSNYRPTDPKEFCGSFSLFSYSLPNLIFPLFRGPYSFDVEILILIGGSFIRHSWERQIQAPTPGPEPKNFLKPSEVTTST